jgi:hypothetical protein
MSPGLAELIRRHFGEVASAGTWRGAEWLLWGNSGQLGRGFRPAAQRTDSRPSRLSPGTGRSDRSRSNAPESCTGSGDRAGAGLRIDRAGEALVGGSLMLAVGAVPPDKLAKSDRHAYPRAATRPDDRGRQLTAFPLLSSRQRLDGDPRASPAPAARRGDPHRRTCDTLSGGFSPTASDTLPIRLATRHGKSAPEGAYKVLIIFRNFGAGEGIRTPDPNLGKVELRYAQGSRRTATDCRRKYAVPRFRVAAIW